MVGSKDVIGLVIGGIAVALLFVLATSLSAGRGVSRIVLPEIPTQIPTQTTTVVEQVREATGGGATRRVGVSSDAPLEEQFTGSQLSYVESGSILDITDAVSEVEPSPETWDAIQNSLL